MRLIVFVILIINSSTCFAFNWDKCKENFKGATDLITVSTTSTASSSSYISSTGDCAKNGKADHDKKVFIAHNAGKIKIDSARGQGEYLEAYARLSGCSKNASRILGISLQRNLTSIFGEKLDYSPEQSYGKIEELVSNDDDLSRGCKPKA